MIHWLTLGFLDVNSVETLGKVVVLQPLDMGTVMRLLREIGEVDEQGNATLGGFPVQLKEGYVICPWLMPYKNLPGVSFAHRLIEETGCMAADIKGREIVHVK